MEDKMEVKMEVLNYLRYTKMTRDLQNRVKELEYVSLGLKAFSLIVILSAQSLSAQSKLVGILGALVFYGLGILFGKKALQYEKDYERQDEALREYFEMDGLVDIDEIEEILLEERIRQRKSKKLKKK